MVTKFSQNQNVDPGYKNPYTDQFVASLERELFRNVGLSVYYVHKRASKRPCLGATRRAQYEDVTILDDVGPGATGRPVVVKRLLTDPAESEFTAGRTTPISRPTPTRSRHS